MSYTFCGESATTLFGVGIPYCDYARDEICKHSKEDGHRSIASWTGIHVLTDSASGLQMWTIWLSVPWNATSNWHTRAKEPAFLNDASIGDEQRYRLLSHHWALFCPQENSFHYTRVTTTVDIFFIVFLSLTQLPSLDSGLDFGRLTILALSSGVLVFLPWVVRN